MDEHDDVGTVARVTEPSVIDGVRVPNETVVENVRGEGEIGGEEREIMVELVGSDVFVDGIGGDRNRGNGVEGFQEIDGSSGDDVVTEEVETTVNEDVVMEEVETMVNEDVVTEEVETTVNEDVVTEEVETTVNEDVVTEEVKSTVHEDVVPEEVKSTVHEDVVVEEVEAKVNEDVVTEEVKLVVNEEGLEKLDDLTERGDASCALTTNSVDEVSVTHDEAVNPGTEVAAQDSVVATGSLSVENKVVSEKVTSFVSEESVERTVESIDEVCAGHLTQQTGGSSDEACSRENEHIHVVAGNFETIERKADQDVHVLGEKEVLATEIREVLNENNCEEEDERESFSKQTQGVNCSEITATYNMLANPVAEVSTTENAGKDVEHVCISEREISGTDIEEAADINDKGPGTEKETVNNSADEQVAVGTEPECSSGQTQGDPVTGMNGISGCSEDLQNMKCEPTSGNAEEDGDVLTNAENSHEQVMVSEIGVELMEIEEALPSEFDALSADASLSCGEDQHMKAVGSSGNDVSQGQEDKGTPVELRVVERAETTVMDNKVYCHSKTTVPVEDSGLGEDKSLTLLTMSGTTGKDDVAMTKSQGPVEVPECDALDAKEDTNFETAGGIIVEDGFADKGPYVSDTSITGATLEEKKDDEENASIQQIGTVTCEDDRDKSMNQLSTYEMSNERASDVALPQIVGKVTYGPQDAHPCPSDLRSHLLDDNLVENMGTYPIDEVRKSESEHFEETVSLPFEFKCIDADLQGIEGDVVLQFPDCLDGSASGDCTGVSSDLGRGMEVEEQYNDEEHVDLHRDQDTEVQNQSTEIEQSQVIDEKTPEEMSPKSGSSMTDGNSSYLLPPENEGEFSVSDLVWGKVRSHPWWPGQIFDPADASEKALKYHKRDCFLVAYFGDRTFAWNDASLLRPFRTHFSQIEKQSNSEAFQNAVSSALGEVSRRVELGLSCSCIPKDALDNIESQIVENTGIHQEAGRRYGVDESSGVSCFEPEKLVENIRSLALFPSGGGNQLELVIAKAQLSAFSRFKGQRPLPEFQLCRGLLENDANTSELGDIKDENKSSNKRKHDVTDSLHQGKKERSMSELMGPHSSDGEEEPDGNIAGMSVSSSAGRKRKALDSVTDGSDKRISFYAAKVSTTSSPIPKPSFKVGECIRRVASQLTGPPSILKCNSEKFLKVDDSVDEDFGFEVSLQSPTHSQRGRIHSPEPSVEEMLSQLHLAARDPMKGYSFLNTITTFFSDFRHSVVLGQKSRKRNSSTGRGGRKKKAPQATINTPEDFEFDDVNDSYWTDRIVQNYSEEQLLPNAQNGEGEHQLVTYEPDQPQKTGRKSRKRVSSGDRQLEAEESSGRRSRKKRFSNGHHELEPEESAEHIDERRQDCSPTELILNFTEGNSVPSEFNLNKIFRRFGPLRESETEVDKQTSRARVVFKKCSDAEVALSSAGKFNIFEPMLVNYELSYVPSAPFKTLPLVTEQAEEDAT